MRTTIVAAYNSRCDYGFPDAAGVYTAVHSCEDPIAAVKAAAAEYATSAEAADLFNDYGINWGDAATHVPAAVLARHGIERLDIALGPVIVVEHDETLARPH